MVHRENIQYKQVMITKSSGDAYTWFKNSQIHSCQITILRTSDKRAFHFKAPLYWKARLPELLSQDGITRVLKDWLLLPCE